MVAQPIPRSLAPALPFKYVGGDAAIDLVNTVDWARAGPVDDRLTSYERLTHWAEGAELSTARLGDALRARAHESPREAERAYRRAGELRWVLRQVFAAIAHGQSLPAQPVAELNAYVSDALTRLQLTSNRQGDGVLRWSWAEPAEHLASVLWPVARAAAELLVSDEARRIRECGSLDCGWLYIDRSRNGLRRWCQMEVCGTREKNRRRADKRSIQT